MTVMTDDVKQVIPLRPFSVMLAACLLSAGCSMPYIPSEGGAERMMLSDPDDAQARARGFVEVVNAVEPVAEAECRAQNPGRNCDFQILVDDRRGVPPNAFQTRDASGRPIIVFTIALIQDVRNREELAFVMAHEAAHHIADHLDRQEANAAQGAQVFAELATLTGASSPESIRAAQELGAAVGQRTYSKDFELEADALGTVITARAGFNPLVGAEFFFRIPDPGNAFLSTHPPTSDRVALVREVAASLGFTEATPAQ
jgi:predicted Zn-dependent protease